MSASHKKELHPDETIKATSLAQWLFKVTVPVGVILLGLSLAAGIAMDDGFIRWSYSYLAAIAYFTSFALGALFFVILQPLVRAYWSVTVRRLAEIMTASFPWLGALIAIGVLVPMVLGATGPYEHWVHMEAEDHMLQQKSAWLNVPFFAIRIAVYYAVWIAISGYFFKKSVEQDQSGDASITERLRVVAGPSIIAFAFSTAFAAFDLLMSLNPHWFSTIFGVYYFAGSAIAVFASLSLIGMFLQRNGILVHSITIEHYHDLGKLLFAFVFFWSYIAFSQFMLIWYANIPEETIWYQTRMFTDWSSVSIFLLVFHCVIPFLFLLSRWTKRVLWRLAFFSTWMLVVHYVDIYYLVMPEYIAPEAAHTELPTFVQLTMDMLTLFGVGCFFVAAMARAASKVNLIPVKDPRLGESLAFENY